MFSFHRYTLPIIFCFGLATCYLLKVVFWPKNEEAMPWHLRLVPLAFAVISGAITAFFVILEFNLPHPFWR